MLPDPRHLTYALPELDADSQRYVDKHGLPIDSFKDRCDSCRDDPLFQTIPKSRDAFAANFAPLPEIPVRFSRATVPLNLMLSCTC